MTVLARYRLDYLNDKLATAVRWSAGAVAPEHHAALAAWQQLKDRRDAGGDPAEEKRAKRVETRAQVAAAAYTVRRCCDEFLRSYEGTVTPKTYREAFQTAYFGKFPDHQALDQELLGHVAERARQELVTAHPEWADPSTLSIGTDA